MLRILLGAACIAIIATAAYYFWGEYRAASSAWDRAAVREAVRAELFQFAKASPGDEKRVIEYCKAASNDPRAIARQVEANCRALDYL